MNNGALTQAVFTSLVVVVFLVAFGLMEAVILKSKQRALKVQFVIAILSLLAWLGSAYAAFLPEFSDQTTFLSRVSISTAILMNLIFFTLIQTIRQERFVFSLGLKLYALYTVVLFPLAYTKAIFLSSVLVNGGMVTTPGPFILLFVAQALIVFVGGIISLARARHKAVDLARRRLNLLLIGFCGMYAGFIFTILIPIVITGNASLVPFGSLYILLFLFIVTICVVRYELFSFRLVAVEVMVFALNLFLLFVALTAESQSAFHTNLAVLIFSILVSILFVRMARNEARLENEHTRFAALEDANQKLRALDLQKSEFLALAAHHLRTPLSVVSGYIDLLKQNAYGKITKETRSVLENMEQNNTQLVHLVDEFLDISSIEQRKINYKMEEFDLNKEIVSAIKELQLKADQKDIQIVWRAGDEVMVVGDAPKIKHAFYNILDNAIKYSKSGKIFISIEEEDGGNSVHVVDSGPGFSPDDKTSLFEKFYRGKNIEKDDVTGTGLGLYVCKKYIEAHKGKVWAESAGIGKGAEFGFWIPSR